MNNRLRLRRSGDRLVAGGTGNGEGHNLHRGDHLSFHYWLIGRQRRQGHRLIDTIESVNRRLVDDQDTGTFCKQIAAPGEGTVGAHALTLDCRSDIGSSLIFRYIARIETSDGYVLHT